jgi:hypothetical protein
MQKILTALILSISGILNAQDTIRADAEITNATIYFGYGAELIPSIKS